MNLKAFIVVFPTLVYLTIQYNDFQVISTSGEKLPIYAGLYYAIKNRDTGNYWARDFETVSKLDNRNADHWHKLEHIEGNAYILSETHYFVVVIEKISNTYYRILVNKGYGMNRANPTGKRECSGEPLMEWIRKWYEWMPNGDYIRPWAKDVHCCIGPFPFYTSTCDTYARQYQWQFIEMPDYKLNAVMSDFELQTPSPIVFERHIKTVHLIESMTVINYASADTEYTFVKEMAKTESFRITYDKNISEASKFFNQYSVNAVIGGEIFDMPIDRLVQFGAELERNSPNANCDSKPISREIAYTLRATVLSRSHENITFYSHLNWAESMPLNYTAIIGVHVFGPQFENNSYASLDTFKIMFNRYGLEENLANRFTDFSGNSIRVFDVPCIYQGLITASFGLDLVCGVSSSYIITEEPIIKANKNLFFRVG